MAKFYAVWLACKFNYFNENLPEFFSLTGIFPNISFNSRSIIAKEDSGRPFMGGSCSNSFMNFVSASTLLWRASASVAKLARSSEILKKNRRGIVIVNIFHTYITVVWTRITTHSIGTEVKLFVFLLQGCPILFIFFLERGPYIFHRYSYVIVREMVLKKIGLDMWNIFHKKHTRTIATHWTYQFGR